MFDLSKAIDSIEKFPPKTLISLVVASGTILFAPVGFVDRLQLLFLRESFGPYVGGTFLVGLSMLLTQWGGKWYAHRRIIKNQRACLRSLTPEEKGFLVPFIFDNEATRYASMESGVVGGLLAQGIIYRSSSVGTSSFTFPYNLQSWARRELAKQRWLLHMDDSEPSPKGMKEREPAQRRLRPVACGER